MSKPSYPGVSTFTVKHETIYGIVKVYTYYKAKSMLNGKAVYLGLFRTKKAAHEAYMNFIEDNQHKIAFNKRYKGNKILIKNKTA